MSNLIAKEYKCFEEELTIEDKISYELILGFRKIKGINIHPGSAKDKMINSILLAKEFDDLLPENEIPSKTCMYEGFHHLCDFNGDVEKTTLHYIIRNHDYSILKRQMNDFNKAANKINKKYSGDFVEVILKENYKNMKEIIEQNDEVLKNAWLTSWPQMSTQMLMPFSRKSSFRRRVVSVCSQAPWPTQITPRLLL